MPLPEDPAYKDWLWFPHGNGKKFTFTKCFEPLESLRDELTVLSGFSHPHGRNVHGHNNADQFLTGASTGTGDTNYKNTISLDQEYARHVGGQTRFSSLVMSTDGGTGTVRGAHTLSFNQNGRAIPAENRPKRIFDMLFVKSDENAARRLALSKSALDDLLVDAQSLKRKLSLHDQKRLDEYLESVRETEIKVEKAKRWINTPLPTVNVDHLNLDVTPNDPRNYVRTMYELIYLAFKTDTTRVATYQIASMGDATTLGGKFPQLLGIGKHLHGLAHDWNKAEGAEALGKWDRFLAEQFVTFLDRMRNTPAGPESDATLLDQTTIIYGCSNSTTHNNKNYPLVLAGGRGIGFQHGQYVKYGEDTPFANVFATMLQQTGVTDRFADSTGVLPELLG